MSKSIVEIFRNYGRGTLSVEDRNYYLQNLMSEEEKAVGKPLFEMNREEELEFNCLSFNNKKGDLKDYDCPICKNKGEVMVVREGAEYYADCKCMAIRRSFENMRRSGLGNLLNLYTFKNYERTAQWQTQAFSSALRFSTDIKARFFLMCGQSGAGKTHLCTAISEKLLEQGLELHYMLWLDESTKIKQVALDQAKYSAMVDNLKNVPVLYIDDFFKTDKTAKPSAADVRLANEIINYRYNKCRADFGKRFITIISTELSIKQMNEIDSAVTGRMVEMAKPNYLIQGFGADKNYRLK